MKHALLPTNYQSRQPQLSELSKFYQLNELKFLLNVSFWAIKVLPTVRVDIPINHSFQRSKKFSSEGTDIAVDSSFQSNQKPVKSGSWNCFWPQLLEPTNFRQKWELTFLPSTAFRASKILSTVRADIADNHSFKSYQNPENVGVDISVNHSFQYYQNLLSLQSWNSC